MSLGPGLARGGIEASDGALACLDNPDDNGARSILRVLSIGER